MDYRLLLKQHVESGAEITLGTVPVTRARRPEFGIMHSDASRRITRFQEKPKEAALLDELTIPDALLAEMGRRAGEELYQASMGIYVFNRQVLIDVLANNDGTDFGKHIIPGAIGQYRVNAYIFQDYWEDIGTIRAFFDANLALTDIIPPYSFFDRNAPIYTRTRFLPASKINGVSIRNAVISDGCILTDARLERCVVGIRSIINSGAELRDVVLMGADYYEGDPRAAALNLPARTRRPSASGATASSSGRSSTRTRASATAWSSRPTASRTITTARITTSATAWWSSRRTPCCRAGVGCEVAEASDCGGEQGNIASPPLASLPIILHGQSVQLERVQASPR